MSSKFVIAVDVGATRTRVGLCTLEGNLVDIVEFHTYKLFQERVTDSTILASKIVETVQSLLRKYNISIQEVIGVGIGSIGPLDVKRGRILKAPNLPVDLELDLREYIQDKLRKDVYVVNDCVAAVWGEKVFGVCRDVENCVYVTFSTGIGGGVIVNGTLLLGADGNAHEIGHVVVDPSPNALRCGCGGYGHWEAYCSGVGIPKYLKKLAEEELREVYSQSSFKSILESNLDPREITVHFFNCLKSGDRFCVEAFERISRLNAAGIATVIHYYNPEVIVLGGAIALNNYDLLLNFRNYLSHYLMDRFRVPEFRKATFGDNSVIIGAAALVVKPPEALVRLLSKK